MQKREAESHHKPVYKVNAKSKSNATKGKAGNAHPSQKKILKAETQAIKLDTDFTTNLMKKFVNSELKKTKKGELEKKKISVAKPKATGMTTPKKKKPKLTEEQKMINYLDPK